MITDIVSVRDHEAFVSKHLPDLGHGVKEFKVYTWRLANWKMLEKRITSPEFHCGDHKWRILLYPFGNPSVLPPHDTVSVYLDYADPNRSPKGWHVCAQFAFAMSNVHNPAVYTAWHANHRFTAKEPDWGFARFSKSCDMLRIREGARRPIIENGSVEVTVYVRILEDPTGLLWDGHDSRMYTGFVGLRSYGTTCHLSPFLQSLFYTCSFRKAVYQIPTEDEDPVKGLPQALALQQVFYRLQTSNEPVGTRDLTRSLGWQSDNPHDIREFGRSLLDNLESKMKGTKAEGAISKLFVGKMRSYIKCVNVDFECSEIEEFKDIPLNIKGMKNLYESFKHFITPEMLDGENMYYAEGYGLQTAKKGVSFESFPPVLHLQLKRFEHDTESNEVVKINDRFEFPSEIDLGEFVDECTAWTQNWIYRLHGVLVHSGNVNGGHYFALIKPDRYTRWLKFDGDCVTAVTDGEVMEGSFGAVSQSNFTEPSQANTDRALKRSTNAYMLVYVREIAIDKILAPLEKEDTPPHLERRVEVEHQMAVEAREFEETRLFLTARVITDDTFARHQGFDLAPFDATHGSLSNLPSFRVLQTEPYDFFKSRIAHHFNLAPNKVRLWVLVNRMNKTVRPDVPIPDNDPTLTLYVICKNARASPDDLRLYLDVVPDPSKPYPPVTATTMVFLKHFAASKQTLYGAGKVYISLSSNVQDICCMINERMKWPLTTPLTLYEEVKPGMIERMNHTLTFAQSEIQNGDIICFQADRTDNSTQDLERQGLCSNPIQFYEFLQHSCPDRTVTASATHAAVAMPSAAGTIQISIPYGIKKFRFSFEQTKPGLVDAEITLGSPPTSDARKKRAISCTGDDNMSDDSDSCSETESITTVPAKKRLRTE